MIYMYYSTEYGENLTNFCLYKQTNKQTNLVGSFDQVLQFVNIHYDRKVLLCGLTGQRKFRKYMQTFTENVKKMPQSDIWGWKFYMENLLK